MATDKSTFPLVSRSESKEYGRDFSIDSDTFTHQVHLTDPEKTVRVYAHLPEEQAIALIAFLREEWEMFAWCPADMPGIPREFAEHALQIKPNTKPVKQALRRFSEPKRRAIGEEVNRLLDAQFIRETKKATWIANSVLVPKKDTDVLRMCVDYGPVNKHCPKDHFPLPRIDQIIDSTKGCDLLSFLNAYSGYNQIRMKEEDEEHTSLITPYGVFCYRTMPFGLKKRRRHLSNDDAGLPKGANRKKRTSLRGRHRHQDLQSIHTTRRPARNLRSAQQIQNQTQPKEVH